MTHFDLNTTTSARKNSLPSPTITKQFPPATLPRPAVSVNDTVSITSHASVTNYGAVAINSAGGGGCL